MFLLQRGFLPLQSPCGRDAHSLMSQQSLFTCFTVPLLFESSPAAAVKHYVCLLWLFFFQLLGQTLTHSFTAKVITISCQTLKDV